MVSAEDVVRALMKGQPKEPKPKSSNRRKNNQNPKLNTYSRLLKTVVNAATGAKTKKNGGAEFDNTL